VIDCIRMKVSIRIILATGTGLIIVAVLFVYLGASLIYGGVYPKDGNGSLGHVGMIIAGLVALFITLVAGGIGIVLILKGRKRADKERQAGQHVVKERA
jgi:hypothetical protein